MDSVTEQWQRSPVWAKYAAITALPAIGYLTARLRDEYQGWLALGPGGMPHNFGGFVTNLFVTAMFAQKETKSLRVYDQPEIYASGWKLVSDDEKAKAQALYLSASLPRRAGPESKSKHYCAPQREHNADEYVDPSLKENYLESFDRLGDANSDAIEWKTSVLEKRGKAMFLRPEYALPSLISKCQREVAHIHDSDTSAHVLLSLRDAREAVEKGWAERHRMSGSTVIPLSYTLLYLPRDEAEVDVFINILEAGMRYAKSSGQSGCE